MEWLSPVLLTVQVVSSLSIIVLVLLQQGKGADMGSSFGGGSAGSLFGATGAANFLSRTTKWAAVVFFVSTAGLAWVAHAPQQAESVIESGVMQGFEADPSVPSVPGSAPAPAAGAAVPNAPTAVPSDVPAAPAASGASSAGTSSGAASSGSAAN